MHSIVIATADEELRVRLLGELAAENRSATCCATWADALAWLVRDATRLVLVDGELPAVSGPVLDAVARSLPSPPSVWALRGDLGPVPTVTSSGHLLRLARSAAPSAITDAEAARLALAGLSGDPLQALRAIADSPLPVRIQGDRGTGKLWVARLAARLRGDAPFLVMRPGDEATVRESEPGTVYLENLELHRGEAILGLLALAEATGWRVVAGSREPPNPKREGIAWTYVTLRPLRERPKDIKPLARLYLDEYQRRLGLPGRRVRNDLWAALERYPWPGNQRELETFIVHAATSARGATLSLDTVPKRVLALLDASDRDRGERQAFEEMVEARLRPVVARFEPAVEGPTLHRIVVDATERALLRLALGRTAGNQKAAAELLGLARNTLRERMERLDPLGEDQ